MSEREFERVLAEAQTEEAIDKALQQYLQSPLEVIPMAGKYKSQEKYDAAHTRQIKMKLNLKTDKDILDRLDASGNIQGYIKRLIREDIERDRGK